MLHVALTLALLVSSCAADQVPLALHQLVQVDVAGDALIRLSGYDYEGNEVEKL